jgi:heme exporter protein D
MEKYYKHLIVIELLSLIFAFVHNYLYMGQAALYVAAFLALVCSVILFWICIKSSVLNRKQKTIGIVVASIPLFIIACGIIFVVLMAQATH